MSSMDKRFPRYRKLLRLYPTKYRDEYGEQMLQTLADMLDDPERSQVSVWTKLALDFVYSVIRQQVASTGEALATNMGTYTRRSSLVGAGFIAPFFIFVSLNGLLHNRLQHSWVWNSWFLFIWILLLPACAVVLAMHALLRKQGARIIFRPGYWRRNWPVLLVLVAGLGILALVFFHDSVHCVAGNPIRELHNPHDTWQCIVRGTL